MPGRTPRRASCFRWALLGLVLAAGGAAGAEEQAAKASKALLVMDIQKAYVDRSPEVQAFIDHVNRVIDATNGKVLTIYVLQQGGGPIDERVHVVSENRFTKTAMDAFTNAELARLLETSGVRDVYLVGLDAEYCVYATAMGAKGHGYAVHAVPDAVITFETEQQVALTHLANLGVELVKDEDLQRAE